MTTPILPSNHRKAINIIQKAQAKAKDGCLSEKEHKRLVAKLRKLGVNIHQSGAAPNQIEDVQIHPWKTDQKGRYFNPWCSDEQGEDAGWNVHSYAPDGCGGGEIVDDDDFEDYETALKHGEALAAKYGVPLRHRTRIMID